MKVYRKAAESIAEGVDRYACDAILWANAEIDSSEKQRLFSEFFNPLPGSISAFWWGPINPENQLARSLGLLLMQEIYDEM